jgi:molybdenum cofactor biosynthesis enzyme MoaA
MPQCVNPYLNLSVTTDGTVRPCCMSTLKFTSDAGHKTVNEASILKFWNSKSRSDMIDALDSGIEIPECEVCWKEERAGKRSKRIRDNETFKNRNLSTDMRPAVVDLSMGNLCNIKCRICSPHHSTQWLVEQAHLLSPSNLKKYTSLEKWRPFKESFEESNQNFWNDILELLPAAEKLDFAGGEPFYIDKHWDIVKMCVDQGWSKNQHIHYNTNGTIFPVKYIHLLEKFNIVDIQISSDGLYDKFEYLRHGAKWSEVETVIDQFLLTKQQSKTKWLIGICLSVSMFNVLDFFEIYEYYSAKGLPVYINIVYDNRGIKCLPTPVKAAIIDKLSKTESKYNRSQWNEDRNMIISHISSTPYSEENWKEVWAEIKIRDNIRKESFENTFPELYFLLKDHIIDYVPCLEKWMIK